MGHYFAASAFKGVPSERLASAIARYLHSYGVSCQQLTGVSSASEFTDAMLYRPANDWTVVIWPLHFNIHDVKLCAEITSHFGSVAVTVNVYETDFWTLEILKAGALVDSFAPRADYFADDEASASAARSAWKGNAQLAASVLEVPLTTISPFYRYIGAGDDDAATARIDDEFSLADFWVFTELWRRVGITYPEDPGAFEIIVRMDPQFGAKLPTWGGGAL